jgi:hypothetical protein
VDKLNWRVSGRIFRTGATTQLQSSAGLVNDATVVGHNLPAETLSGAVTIRVTGQGTSNDDVVLTQFIVGWDDVNT